jgi:hypothetical protein
MTLNDFVAYLPDHSYICTPTGTVWNAAGVNAALPRVPVTCGGEPVLDKKTGEPRTVPAAMWLDHNRPVHHLTWAPGFPTLIKNKLLLEAQWVERKGVTTYNFYRASTLKHGDKTKAGPWLSFVKKLYPNDWEHVVLFFAQCLQQPATKINHGLVLGGKPGIGKDTLIEPIKRGVGAGNFREVSPSQMLGRFNNFVKTVVLRISELRVLGEFNRYQLYEHLKPYLAAPPDALRVDEKNTPEHDVLNCLAVVMTTNHLTDGMYLPPDDRRHYVAWSDLSHTDFVPGYFDKIWRWYDSGGYGHVAAYLAALDISEFDPKAPPRKTDAFWQIVDSNRAPEEGELADVIDALCNPDALTLEDVCGKANYTFASWLEDRKNRRTIPHRFEKCDYVRVRNDDTEDGLWRIDGVRQTVYARAGLSRRDQILAARQLADKRVLEKAQVRVQAAEKAARKGEGIKGVRL